MKYRNKYHADIVVDAVKMPAGSVGIDTAGRSRKEYHPVVDFYQITDSFGDKWICTEPGFSEAYESTTENEVQDGKG